MTGGPFESDATRAPERVAALTAALGRWRRELSGVGGPNTLLWYVDGGSGVLDLTTAHPGGVSMLLAGRPTRLSDLVRERAAFAEARARAAEIRGRAIELRARRGLETSFLAAGMASWEHPGTSAQPQAPVLLRSCTLRPTDPVAADFDVVLGDEVEFNPVLDQYLRSAAGIDLDTVSLAEMSKIWRGGSSGFDPYPVYAALARLCEGLPGFTVTPRVLIGTFPHGKLTMVQDLADLAEPASAQRLASHTVLAALASGDAETDRRGPVEPPADLDPDPDPAGERLVLDADSAQGGVVEAVLRGQDVVVHAPPGTGTTQTAANLVAALAGERNSVLLVAERAAEIEDVRARLDEVGLGALVFPAAQALFDRRGTLGRLVERVDAREDEGSAGSGVRAEERLREQRDVLRDHVAALHEVRVPWDVSVHEAQGAIAELGSRSPAPASRVRIRGAALARLSRERLHELADELAEAAEVGAWSAGEAGDPWYGARVTTQDEAERTREVVARLAGGGFDEHAAQLDAILAESSLPPARTVNDWRVAVATMAGVRDTLEVFRPEIFDIPLDEHVAATATREYRRAEGVDLGWASRARVRRLATRLLRPGRPPADLHAELVRARTQRAAWYALVGAGGRPEISPRLDEAQAAYEQLDADLTWLSERLAPTAGGGELSTTPLPQLRERLASLADRPERLAVLPRVVPVIDDLRAAGMGEVVDDFAARGVEADQVTPELEHNWWLSIAQHVADSDARYGRHDGQSLRAAVTEYAEADHDHLSATVGRTLREVRERRAAAVDTHRTAATMLRAEAQSDRRPMALRSAFDAASELVLAAAPCWAMSPLEVGECIPPGQWFDVAVVLGAGTLTTPAAVSALSRARQVVTFGDPALAGPTAYETSWGSAAVPSDEAAPVSLLDELTSRLPVHRLRWAHGFADERLVELPNRLVYAGELLSVPAPSEATPVSLELVDGRAGVEPGQDTSIDSTDGEVDRVVELVLAHAASSPSESLGVVALTERHADRIREALAAAAGRLDPVADASALAFLAADAPTPVAVVSMGVAAGLSRDCVVLSVGYGKTPHGRVLHRFPALLAPEAERGLATALTMARRRLVVVSSLSVTDLNPERLRDGGERLLELLRYAEEGTPPEPETVDSLMGDLAQRLRREGLVVGQGVGIGRRRVELAVTDTAHQGRWLVAVDGDGPEYASWYGTRERDRIWPESLERRGWRHLRVWSTDLYRDPAREVARVVSAVREVSRAGHAPEDADGELTGRAGADEPGAAGEPAERGEPAGSGDPTEAPEPEDTDEVSEAAGPSEANGRSGASEPTEPAESSDAGEPADGAQPSADTARSKDESEPPADSAFTAPPPEPAPPPGGRTRRRGFRRAGRPAGSPDGPVDGPDRTGQTRDDTDAGWGERADQRDHDRWLNDQRPPHWE